MDSAVDRHVFYISDGTAITAEVLGHAVMSQFPVTISSITLPFVENESRAGQLKIKSMLFIIKRVYDHWFSIPSSYRKFALSFCKVKDFAGISSGRWWHLCNKK